MPTFQESVNGALKGGLCAVLAANETAAKVLTSVSGDPLGVAKLAGGLRRQVCSDDPENDPVPEVPFSGGQCPGTVYLITWTLNQPGSPPLNQQSDRVGPLTLSRALEPGDENAGCAEGETFNRYTMLSQGTPLGLGSGCGVTVTNIDVSPLFGMPDNCGDPGPEPLPDPEPVAPELPDITYNIDGDTTITVPITAVYAPIFVDLDGSLKMPITLNVGGIDFNGSLTLAPEFEVEFKPTINIGGPGSPDDPEGIGEPGGGSEPIDDLEELESTIVGVLVYSDIDSNAGPSGIEFTNGPDIYAPRLASVTFAIKTKNSIGWTPDQDVKNLECYVPCPAPQGAIAVRVNPVPGVQSRFTAVRAQPLTSF